MSANVGMRVRRAHPTDWLAVERLNRRTQRAFSWLRSWGKYLVDDLFIVVERECAIVGALFAQTEESPVAWVRLAALDNDLDVGEWLDMVLPPVLDKLHRRGIRALAWIDRGNWAGAYLNVRGFTRLTEVVTLAKFDRVLPEVDDVDVRLRRPSPADLPAVIAVDRAALSPHWWRSGSDMLQRVSGASYFVVAEIGDDVAGYAEGELHVPTAHLNRIAVHPDRQGCGIGSFLLCDALRTFWQSGASQVTLNTQIDNLRSRRLYNRFGFGPTGDEVTVWELRV